MKTRILIIIVTYNSEKHLQWSIDGLGGTKLKIDLCIVDSGSTDSSYLNSIVIPSGITLTVIKEKNIGFVAANNLALTNLENYDFVLYLNPDARIDARDLEKLIHIANLDSNKNIGAFTVPLIRFDIDNMCPINTYDSVGIKCNFFGKWYDDMANEPVSNLPRSQSIFFTEAICGAFMLVKTDILMSALDSVGKPGFESSFYMYKEDIELSCRIRSKGYKLAILNSVNAFHCRGWQGKRKNIPYWARFQSAKNDIFVAFKYKKKALPFSILKFLFVTLIERR